MAKNKTQDAAKCISVGGQAVLEGVMMQGPERIAMAVRRTDGKVALTVKPVKKLSDKYPILGWPIIRGVVNFVAQLYSGVKMLAESAEMGGLEEEEPSEFEKKVAAFLHMKPDDVMMIFAVILALVMMIGLFFVIPTGVESLLKRFITSSFALNLIGGLLRMAMFLGYVLLVSRMKEIHRVFQYHGAEHKSIFCFESGKELTVENAQTFTTLHPRCGTSFLVIVFTISIIIFTFFGTDSSNVFLRVGSRLLLLPVTAGVSYEILKWLGRAEDTPLVRALKWPGLMMQKLTTAQPEDDMVEVALIALKAALGMSDALPDHLKVDEESKSEESKSKEAEKQA